MTAREWFLVVWWMLWTVVLIGGIVYAVKEALRHKREARRIKRVPLVDRWWRLMVG